MHPEEIRTRGLEPKACTAVRVEGFRREFCQEPSWRSAESERRAVLTVKPAEGCWFNAVLVPDIGPELLPRLDHRERGYRRVEVPSERITTYSADAPEVNDAAILYSGREEKYNDAILPSGEYLELCLDAASHWGDPFLKDFMKSTYVQGRTPLLDYGSRDS